MGMSGWCEDCGSRISEHDDNACNVARLTKESETLHGENERLRSALKTIVDGCEDAGEDVSHTWIIQKAKAALESNVICDCGEPCHCGKVRNHYCNHKTLDKTQKRTL